MKHMAGEFHAVAKNAGCAQIGDRPATGNRSKVDKEVHDVSRPLRAVLQKDCKHPDRWDLRMKPANHAWRSLCCKTKVMHVQMKSIEASAQKRALTIPCIALIQFREAII